MHQLLRITAEAVDEDTIRLTDRADDASILVDTPLGLGPVPVGVSRQPFLAPADEDVNLWISDRVGTRVRLVWQEDPASRPISGARGGLPGETMSLADAGPVLLTSETSLAQLNAWIAADVDQPDVADIDPADLSDTSAGRSVGGLEIAAVPAERRRRRGRAVRRGGLARRTDRRRGVPHHEVCDRCVMTTLDPVTLEGGKEPIRTAGPPPPLGRQDVVRHAAGADRRRRLATRRRPGGAPRLTRPPD